MAEGAAVALRAVRGVDDHLGRGGLDRVGVLKLGVPDEHVVALDQQVPYAVTGAAAQVQPALLGDRGLAVDLRGRPDQGEDPVGPAGVQLVEGLDPAGAHGGLLRCCVGHGTELTTAGVREVSIGTSAAAPQATNAAAARAGQ